MLDKKEFEAIPEETAFRIVIEGTGEDEMMYVAIKGGPDWAIYCHHMSYLKDMLPFSSIDGLKDLVLDSGNKTSFKGTIQNIVPCTDDVLKLYRY